MPHNRESDCLDSCVITKADLGHYVHKKTYEPYSSNPSPPLILRIKQSSPYAQVQNKRRSPKEAYGISISTAGTNIVRATQGHPRLLATSIRHPHDAPNTSAQNPCTLGDVSVGFIYIDKT